MNRPLPLEGALPEPASRSRLAIAGKGFRPFFFGASVFAALIVPLWLLIMNGTVVPGAYLDTISWHAHEMIFGYTAAVIAGFLLTAVANWTQRETLIGPPLLALAALWVFGRVVMVMPNAFPRGLVAAVDLAFLPALAIVLARPLIATRNRRNFVMLAVLSVLAAANLAVHLEALGVARPGMARHAIHVAIDVVVFLMLVIAGRILPMFTRNATQVKTIVSSPTLDRLTAVAAAALIVVDLAWPDTLAANVAACAVAFVATVRAARWGTRHALRQPLLWILHAGYWWIPIGLVLRAVSVAGAMHALTVGAIGALTVGMMARVSLGHTGRKLAPSHLTVAAFAAISLAAVARVFLPLVTPHYFVALTVAGGLWTLTFVLYLTTYTPYLFTPRPDGKAG